MRKLLIAGLATVAFGGNALAETWQSYSYTTGTLENERMTALAERITEATGGKLEINFTRGGGLPINGNDVQQAIAEDVIQLGNVGGGAVSLVPIFGIGRLPGLYYSDEEFAKGSEILRPYLEKAFAEKGLTYICAHHFPEQTIFTNRPVTSGADLTGLKIRITTPELGPVVQEFGAIPITLSVPDVPPSLQQGAIHGAITAAAGGGRIWADLLTHNYRIPISYSSGAVIVNKARFDALDAETQATVRKLSEEECDTITAGSLGGEAEWVGKLGAQGMVISKAAEADIERLRTISPKIWEESAAKVGPDGIEALAEIRAALGR